MRDSIPMYRGFGGDDTPEDFARAARETVAMGFTTLKCCPFEHEMGEYQTSFLDGNISTEGEALAIDKVAAVREATGLGIELLVEAHAHFNVPNCHPYR